MEVVTDASCKDCGYPTTNGVCHRCHEEAQKIRKYGIAALGGVRAFEEFTVKAFSPSPIQKAALEAAKLFDPAKQNLYIHGPVGSGKSHLAAIAARNFLGKLVVKTTNPFEISRSVRGAGSGLEEIAVLRSLAEVKLLVIDDLGAAKDTEFLVGLMYEIVNHRYLNHRGGLIVTSNLSLSDLSVKMADDRVVSRLAQMCKVVCLNGEFDHRIPKP